MSTTDYTTTMSNNNDSVKYLRQQMMYRRTPIAIPTKDPTVAATAITTVSVSLQSGKTSQIVSQSMQIGKFVGSAHINRHQQLMK